MIVSLDVLFNADKLVAVTMESDDQILCDTVLSVRNGIRTLVLEHIKFERRLRPYEISIRDWSDHLRHAVYWLDESNDHIVGPMCGHCWEAHQSLERLQYVEATHSYLCPECKTIY